MGLGGLVYWYVTYPLHRFIFVGMLREIAEIAENHLWECRYLADHAYVHLSRSCLTGRSNVD